MVLTLNGLRALYAKTYKHLGFEVRHVDVWSKFCVCFKWYACVSWICLLTVGPSVGIECISCGYYEQLCDKWQAHLISIGHPWLPETVILPVSFYAAVVVLMDVQRFPLVKLNSLVLMVRLGRGSGDLGNFRNYLLVVCFVRMWPYFIRLCKALMILPVEYTEIKCQLFFIAAVA